MKITSIERTDKISIVMESLSVDNVCDAIRDGMLEDYLNGIKQLIREVIDDGTSIL